MEILGLINLPWWLFSFLLLVFTVVIYTIYKRSLFSRHGFVTKDSKFFLGDLGDITKKGFTIYDVESVKKYGKVYGSFMGNFPMLIISDPDMIKVISIKQFNNFQNRLSFRSKPMGFNEGLTMAEGVYWKYLRSVLGRCFSSGKLRAMNSNVATCMQRFMDNVENKIKESPDGVDVVKLFRAYTMDVICSTGFGMDVDSQKDPNNPFVKNAELAFTRSFTQSITVLINMFFPDFPGLEYTTFTTAGGKKVMDFFQTATRTLLNERKKEAATCNRFLYEDPKLLKAVCCRGIKRRHYEVYPDILQAMIDAQREEIEDIIIQEKEKMTMEDIKKQGLTDNQVVSNSVIFVLGAYETTSITLSWLVYDLAIHTEVQDKLIKEIDDVLGPNSPNYDSLQKLQYLGMVIDETARFHPVASLMTRTAKEDSEVCGVHIPAGMPIVFPAFALHFMEEYWEEPQKYNPERFAPENKDNINEYAYIPFGLGPRNCIGMRLALLEVKMNIVTILQKYRIEKSDQLPVPMPGSATSMYKPEKPVVVKLIERN